MRAGFGQIGARISKRGIPLLRGREFSDADVQDTPAVAVVNETLARRLWRNAEVIDHQLMVGSQAHRVVGIVGDATLSNRADGPRPHGYTPFWQSPRQVDAQLAIRVREWIPARRAASVMPAAALRHD